KVMTLATDQRRRQCLSPSLFLPGNFVMQRIEDAIQPAPASIAARQPKRHLRVKLILPALTEASSPYWRPVKYALFPPLGLATLAGYLEPEDHAVIVDEHVQPLTTDDAPDLVLIQV